VKWSTNVEQANNRRTTIRYMFDGENLTLSEISRKTGVSYSRIWKAKKLFGNPSEHEKLDPNLMRRLRTGVDFDLAISHPLQSGVNFKEKLKWS
jgi:hypothetical protein